jgi:DNA-binding CsgD family transcriptional regulator
MSERSFQEAVDQLSKVPTKEGPRAVLDAIARCVPVAGGTIGTMLIQGATPSVTSHAVHLPSDMFDAWMSTPPQDFARMMAPIVRGPVGGLFTDKTEITGRFREQLDVIRCVRAAGFGETAGFKVASRLGASGGMEVVFMTLALDSGETFSPEHHDVLAALQPSIEATVRRLQVPLVSSRSILAQILEEQTIGYACTADGGRVVEANERAYMLALRYAHTAGLTPGRNTLRELAAHLHGASEHHCMHRFGGGARDGVLEVSTHRLAKETHEIHEDLTLLVMREVSSAADAAALDVLTERQRQVAIQLVMSERSYKQIANALAISEGTMRKHAENIYRRLGVQSRQELVLRCKKPGSS